MKKTALSELQSLKLKGNFTRRLTVNGEFGLSDVLFDVDIKKVAELMEAYANQSKWIAVEKRDTQILDWIDGVEKRLLKGNHKSPILIELREYLNFIRQPLPNPPQP